MTMPSRPWITSSDRSLMLCSRPQEIAAARVEKSLEARPAPYFFTPHAPSIVRTIDGAWGVKKYGAGRASKLFSTRAAAISWGREQSIKERSELVIHGRDGMVIKKDSYGLDPHPPRDRKK